MSTKATGLDGFRDPLGLGLYNENAFELGGPMLPGPRVSEYGSSGGQYAPRADVAYAFAQGQRGALLLLGLALLVVVVSS